METKELLEKFLQFEYENNLFEWEVRGFKFWHFLRFDIYYNVLLKQLKGVEPAHDAYDMAGLRKFAVFFRKVLKCGEKLFGVEPLSRLKKKDVLVFSHPRRVKDGDYYICPYTDTFLPYFNRSYYVFENMYQRKHFKPVRTKNLKHLDSFLVGSSLALRAKDLLFGSRLGNHGIKITRELTKKLQFQFDIAVDERELMHQISKVIRWGEVWGRELDKIIRKVNPKLIIQVVSYIPVNMMINAIAKKRNIKTVELQHGIMGRYHVAYNFLARYSLETFPDYFFLFGNYWKDTTRLPLDNCHQIVTGFPYFHKKISEYRSMRKLPDSKRNILFVSGGTTGTRLSRLACDVASMIEKTKYNIIYKLHPGEYLRWRKQYPWLNDSWIEVVDDNEKSIYHYFAISDYLVGVGSTAIFESLPFHLKLLIVTEPGYEYCEDLYNNNYAKLVSSAQDIMQALNWESSNIERIVKKFWEDSACQNIIENISKLLGD